MHCVQRGVTPLEKSHKVTFHDLRCLLAKSQKEKVTKRLRNFLKSYTNPSGPDRVGKAFLGALSESRTNPVSLLVLMVTVSALIQQPGRAPGNSKPENETVFVCCFQSRSDALWSPVPPDPVSVQAE